MPDMKSKFWSNYFQALLAISIMALLGCLSLFLLFFPAYMTVVHGQGWWLIAYLVEGLFIAYPLVTAIEEL